MASATVVLAGRRNSRRRSVWLGLGDVGADEPATLNCDDRRRAARSASDDGSKDMPSGRSCGWTTIWSVKRPLAAATAADAGTNGDSGSLARVSTPARRGEAAADVGAAAPRLRWM